MAVQTIGRQWKDASIKLLIVIREKRCNITPLMMLLREIYNPLDSIFDCLENNEQNVAG